MFNLRTWLKGAYIAGAELLGWTLIVLGIAMLALPGPGMLGLFAGVVVLSERYTWARRVKGKAKRLAEDGAKASVLTHGRIGFSVLSAFFIAAVGTWVFTDPRLPSFVDFSVLSLDVGPSLPGAGPLMGGGMVASAALALGILAYSVRRYREEARAELAEAS